MVGSVRPVKSHLMRAGRRHCGGAGHVSTLCSTSRLRGDATEGQQPSKTLPKAADPALRHRFSTHSLTLMMEEVDRSFKIHSERLSTVKFPPNTLLAAGFNPVLKAR